MNESAPRLIVDLTDQVLIYAIRLHVGASHDFRRTSHDLRLIHTHLTAADPEAHHNRLVRAAIMAAWWLDLNWASERGLVPLLDHMLDLHHAGKRPLQYSRHGVDRAAEKGFFDVVQWWYARKSERIMWFPDVGPASLGCGIVLVSDQEERKTGSAECDLNQLLEWVVVHICTNDTVAGSHFTETVESIITCAIRSGNHQVLQSLSPHLERNQERLVLTYDMRLARLPGKYKQAWAVEWLASNLAHYDLKGCHLQAFVGSFGSGDLEWVQWCFGEWQSHARSLDQSDGKQPTPCVSDLRTGLGVAGCAGHLELIEWMAAQFPSLNSCDSLFIRLDEIALQGHLHVVEWWKSVGADVFPQARLVSESLNILHRLTERGLTELVQWWVESSELPFEAGEAPIVAAAKFGNVELLNWWDARLQSGKCQKSRTIRFTLTALEIASVNGQVVVLDWWKKHGKPFPQPLQYGPFYHVKRLCRCGQLRSLKWWYRHIMDSTDPPSSCMWTDKNCIRELLQLAQASQLDVFEWLADILARQFDKPAWLHMRNETSIHPLLVKYYLGHGFQLQLSDWGLQQLVATAIRKGQVLVLHDLHRQLNNLPLARFNSPIWRIRPEFGRQMCVLDYLVRHHGARWRASCNLIVHYLTSATAVYALEWMEHVHPRVELPPMAQVFPQAQQSYQFRDGSLLESSRKWVQRRMKEESQGQ